MLSMGVVFQGIRLCDIFFILAKIEMVYRLATHAIDKWLFHIRLDKSPLWQNTDYNMCDMWYVYTFVRL